MSRLTFARLAAAWLVLAPAMCFSQVTIRVDASRTQGPFKPVWNYFGYDEPNYTYAQNGRKLIGELSDASYVPVHIRTHNLLTTGNGVAALKWGSTNAYTEDASGKPVYDWTIVDEILDTYLQMGVKPFVEIGFMPEALSTHPEPYQHNFPQGSVYTGWSYPPKDYAKWGELVYQWAKHCAATYGEAEAASWDWEVWNEPDIGYWHGTPEEYDKLYDYSVAAVRRALPAARVGGPATTGPSNAKAAAFLQQFLKHCASGKNAATGADGAPLDFITFHAKGSPELIESHVAMGITHELRDAVEGFRIVNSFDKFRNLPIVLSEADPEGCAACSAKTNPRNAYRNGTLYPSYVAVAMKALMQLAERERANLEGILTWAFEFEDQPYFEGFRSLATNGIDKPVLNIFRMAGLLRGDVLQFESSAAIPLDALAESGVRRHSDIDGLAVRSDREISIMLWNYRDEDVHAPAADISLRITGLPSTARFMSMRHYRIDQDHSNAYTAWQEMGSPQHPGTEERERLERSAQLQLLESPRWILSSASTLDLRFALPLQAVSLIELSW